MSTKLYVGNLPYNTTQEELSELFGKHGEVVEVALITDRETGRSKGFGFVTMADAAAAQQAIQRLNGTSLNNRTLTVNEARPREERSGGGGYGGGGNGGGGYRGGGGNDRRSNNRW
jgi:RNA recognition motif-containing protein